jgi:hypothetical protein
MPKIPLKIDLHSQNGAIQNSFADKSALILRNSSLFKLANITNNGRFASPLRFGHKPSKPGCAMPTLHGIRQFVLTHLLI